jgi:CBS-domain-containing membrane protein
LSPAIVGHRRRRQRADPRTIRGGRATDTLDRAAQRMWDHAIGAIVVVDEHGQVVGRITDRDACMAAYLLGGGGCAPGHHLRG